MKKNNKYDLSKVTEVVNKNVIYDKIADIVNRVISEIQYSNEHEEYYLTNDIKFVIYKDNEIDDLYAVYTYYKGELQEDLDTGDVHISDLDTRLLEIADTLLNLNEAKQIKFADKDNYTAYIVDKDFNLDNLPDDVEYTLVHNLQKTGTKMFCTTRPLTDEERKEFNIRLNSEEVTPEEMKELFSENKKDEPVIVLNYGRGTRFPDRKTAIDYYKECIEGTDPNGAENYSYQNILYSLMHTNKDVVYDIDDETEYDWWVQKGKPTDDVSDELLKAHLRESKDSNKSFSADIKSLYDKYGEKGMRWCRIEHKVDDNNEYYDLYYRKPWGYEFLACCDGEDVTVVDIQDDCVILKTIDNDDIFEVIPEEFEIISNNKLNDDRTMKKEDLSDKDMKELDEYTETEIRKMYDKYCSENNDKKSFEEWQKENVDSALVNELEYEFFSNRKKTEDLDIEDNNVGQTLNDVLISIGDGHDIADNVYDVEVFFALIDEPDTSDNYDLYIQGLGNILKVVDAFDENDANIIVNLTDYVIANKDVLLDLFEVNGETDEEIMEDLVCRVMPLVIAGYTTDSAYKILLNTVKGGK